MNIDRIRAATRIADVNHHRINILGASGVGTSTVGRALAVSLGVPHFESDDYYHGFSDPPFQNPRSPDERYALITADLGGASSWVLSGGVAGWDPDPRLDFTLMVFLWAPALVRIERLRRREHERFGDRIREGGDMFEAHEKFIAWASRYDAGDVEGKTLARHQTYLAAQSCPILELRDVVSTDQAVDRIRNALAKFD